MKKSSILIVFIVLIAAASLGLFFRKLSLRRDCFRLLKANVESLAPTLNNASALKAAAAESKYPNLSDLVFGAMTEYQNSISAALKKDFLGTSIAEQDRLIEKFIDTGNDVAHDLEKWSQNSASKQSAKLKTVVEIWKADLEKFKQVRKNLKLCY